MYLVSTGPIDDCAGGTDLDTAAALDAGALSERNIGISHNRALGAAFRYRKSKVTCHFGTSPHTTPAQDTAVIIQNKIGMRCIHYKLIPARLNRPMRHFF